MKIVILGGGTAGWIAALMISKVYPSIHEVTIVESSSLGTIGVGESSTGLLRGIVNNEVWNYGCNEVDFIKYTNAIPKLAIQYKNWKNDGSSYIEPIDSIDTDQFVWSDRLLLSCVANDIPMHLSSINGIMVDQKLSPFYIKENFAFNSQRHGYTFDAKLGAEYFKKICINDVTHIDAKVIDIDIESNGMASSLVLDNGSKVSGDFFIDASGFSKIFSKKMNIGWKEYNDLPLNSALPFLMEHEDNLDIDFVSTSIAKKYGWMWKNPKSDVMACGYVYDDNFITPDEAQKEIEKDLGTQIYPIKNLKFESGRLEKFWEKNVLFIGLGSNFLEPLEATSIHGTIAQLNMFIFSYLKNNIKHTLNDYTIKKYNRYVSSMLENFKNFIMIHYMGNKEDSDFWKLMKSNVKNNDFLQEISNIGQYRLLNEYDIEKVYGYADHRLFNWLLVALDFYKKDKAIEELGILDLSNVLDNEVHALSSYIQEKTWMSNQEFLKFVKEYNNDYL